MSLLISIAINGGHPVELVVARRTAGSERPDSVNSYTVQRFDMGPGGPRQIGDAQEVLHTYGHGAAVPACRALEAVVQ